LAAGARSTVRVLTRSEAVVLWHLLARDRPRVDPLPGVERPHRRTMQDVRQRAYARGWIRDRFVPAPTAFGLDRLTFALARPLADRLRGQAERWRARPENVLLWSSSEGLFGVFLSGPGTDPELARTLAADGEGAVLYPVAVPAREEAVPVYFDFELAWVRANGLPGASAGYPRPIPEAPVGEDGPPPRRSSARRSAPRSPPARSTRPPCVRSGRSSEAPSRNAASAPAGARSAACSTPSPWPP